MIFNCIWYLTDEQALKSSVVGYKSSTLLKPQIYHDDSQHVMHAENRNRLTYLQEWWAMEHFLNLCI